MSNKRYAVVYLRRSGVSDDRPGDISEDAQLEAGRGLAHVYAPDAQLMVFKDWGISGRRDDRKDYVRLKAAIRRDEVCCVFVYSLSRLGRTASELDSFFELCKAHGVELVSKSEGVLSADTAMGTFLLKVMAAMAQMESDVARERSAAARAAREARGDKMGHAPIGYELVRGENNRIERARKEDHADLQAVLDAYTEAGTFAGACRLLSARGIPTVHGKTVEVDGVAKPNWSPSTVRDIIEREMPEAIPPAAASGVRRRNNVESTFARLLVCHCGRVMTPHAKRRAYYCSRGTTMADHGKYNVPESRILAFAMDQTDRWMAGPAFERAQHVGAVIDVAEARVAALKKKRTDLVKFIGVWDEKQIMDEVKAIDAELESLKVAERDVEYLEMGTFGIDWDRPAGEINADLRRIWTAIRLDKELNPVEVEWTSSIFHDFEEEPLGALFSEG